MPSREPELYKDKVEVSLDGRQIFYLFFGGSVIVGIVFVLGVLVGRRVEARGHVGHAQTHSATDPLAALDRLEGSGGLSFQGALNGGAPAAAANAAPVEKAIDDIAKQRAANPPAPAAQPAVAKPADKPADKNIDKAIEKPADKASDKAGDKASDKAKADKAAPMDGPVVKPEADKPKADKPKADADKVKAEADKPKADKAKAADADKPKDVAEADAPKSRYTLQLSAFQDRGEAEAFLAKMKDQGYQASITQAEVEGKGTYYRVRLGTYKSMDAANKAKADLEGAGKSATVMKM